MTSSLLHTTLVVVGILVYCGFLLYLFSKTRMRGRMEGAALVAGLVALVAALYFGMNAFASDEADRENVVGFADYDSSASALFDVTPCNDLSAKDCWFVAPRYVGPTHPAYPRSDGREAGAQSIPEPGSLALLAIAGAGLLISRKRT